VLVLARLGQVANPLDWLVAALLLDSAEAHAQSRAREHGHVEVERDRGLDPRLLVFGRDEMHVRSEQILRVALKLLEAPHDARVVLGLVAGFSAPLRVDPHVGSGFGHGDFDDDVGREVRRFEDGLDAN